MQIEFVERNCSSVEYNISFKRDVKIKKEFGDLEARKEGDMRISFVSFSYFITITFCLFTAESHCIVEKSASTQDYCLYD